MISKYEYWAHRLFPKMKFIEVVEKLEKLGDKREVKVNINKKEDNELIFFVKFNFTKSMMHRIRLNEMLDAKELEVPDQDEDALEENQIMTERVMNMVDTDEEITTQTRTQEEDEDEILKNLLNI